MFIITNEEFKKIVGIESYNGSMFKKESKIFLNFPIQEDQKLLKVSFRVETIEGYKENHYFEIEAGLKMLEEILTFSAYEQKKKQNETELGELTFLVEREKELNNIFSIFNIKRTTYADYLRKTSKDAYIKVEIHELLKLLKRLTGQPVPEDLIGKIKQEASKRENYKLAVHFTKWASSEQDDRIIFTVLPNIFDRILTVHEHQDAIEEVFLEQSYKCNVIEKEELFERIDELNKIFKVKKDRKHFENKVDLISENFLVCPNKNFLPKAGPLMCGTVIGEPKIEITTFKPDFSFIWNQKPFDLAGYKFETMNEWEAYKSKKEVDEKFEQANNNGNKEKPKFKFGTFISPVMDNRSLKEITEEIIKTTEGDKNNMNTNKNKNKPMRPDSIMFDEENKITVAFLGGEKFIIKCNDGDKFNYRIALGVACSRVNCNNTELIYLREHMNWKEYYLYCYNKFFYFDPVRIKAFENSVYAEKEQYKLKLDEEKVRKYRCEEVEFNVYKPKKITHDFILFNPQGE